MLDYRRRWIGSAPAATRFRLVARDRGDRALGGVLTLPEGEPDSAQVRYVSWRKSCAQCLFSAPDLDTRLSVRCESPASQGPALKRINRDNATLALNVMMLPRCSMTEPSGSVLLPRSK
jgi:hypothetical protein